MGSQMPGFWADPFATRRPTSLPETPRHLRFSDEEFDALCTDFQDTGGVARGDELAHLLEDHPPGASASLSRLIASNQVFGFDRDFSFWVPMFQFEPDSLRIRPAVLKVRAELGSEFDGWAFATWFAAPSAWLRQRRPVDLLESNLREVLQAARIDRFIAAG